MTAQVPEGAPNLVVRQAVFSDLEVIAPLFDASRQFYGKASDVPAARQFLSDRFEHGQSVVFLAFWAQRPHGFTQLYPSFSSVSMARVFVLNDVYVAPEGRRKGIAQALLQAASDHARQLGAVRLSLNTDIQNTAAQALYDAAGWLRDRKFYAYHLHLDQPAV